MPPIPITRAEYEKKFGAPVSDQAPLHVTRAEFDALQRELGEKPMKFDVPISDADRKNNIARYQQEAKAYQAEADKYDFNWNPKNWSLRHNPMEALGTYANAVVGDLFQGTNEILNKTFKQSLDINMGSLDGYNEAIQANETTKVLMVKAIREKEEKGEDATKLKQIYNSAVDDGERLSLSIAEKSALPTTLRTSAKLVQFAIEVLSVGTYGRATGALAGMESGKLAPSLASLPAPLQFLRDSATRPAGIFTKKGLERIAEGGIFGYSYDVASGLAGDRGEDRTGTNAFIPGAMTALGIGLPAGIAGAKSFANVATKAGRETRTAEIRVDALTQLERDNQNVRNAFNDYRETTGKEPIDILSRTEALNDVVDTNGTISMQNPLGKLNEIISQSDSVVTKQLTRDGTAIGAPQFIGGLLDGLQNTRLRLTERDALGSQIKALIKNIQSNVDSNGKVPLVNVHQAKISLGQKLKKQWGTTRGTVNKELYRIYKGIVEKHSETLDVQNHNLQLSELYALRDVFISLNGKKVEGGRLGKHVSTAIGASIGMATHNPLLGLAGAKIAPMLRGQQMKRAFGGKVRGAVAQKVVSRNKITSTERRPIDVTKGKSANADKQIAEQRSKSVKPKASVSKGRSIDEIRIRNKAHIETLRASLVTRTVDKIKKYNKEAQIGLSTKDVSGEATTLNRATKYLREAKGLSANDIMKKHPDIQLKRDLTVKNIHGQTQVIPEGEVLTPYELKGNKVLLQDGKTYVVSKNQFQNVKGQSISGEAKEFAPELKGTEERVLGSRTQDFANAESEYNQLVVDLKKKYDPTGRFNMNMIHDEMSSADKTRFAEAKKKTELARNQDTKYSSYTLPGGENYKEILIKAPTKQDTKVYWDMEQYDKFPPEVTKLMDKYVDDYDGMSKALTKLGYEVDTDMSGEIIGFQKVPSKETLFKSSHWDEPNVIFHLRLNERTYKGKKVTFMEELQSDWAREARKSQEILNKERQMYERDLALLKTEKDVVNRQAKIEALEEKLADFKSDVPQTPSNPLLKNWQTLSVKRALQEAVANKSEYFAWINGEQTSARYNLATHLNSVEWKSPTKKGLYEGQQDKNVILDIAGGRGKVNLELNPQGEVIRTFGTGGENWKGKKLDEVLGKGLADSIMSKESGTLSGEGLKFGGEWANTLYDKQVGNIVKDLTGAPIEKMDMGLPIDGKKPNFSIAQDSGPLKGHFNIKATPETLKVGSEILNRETDATYIVTNILGDGKFKAVPKSAYFAEVYDPAIGIENTYKKARPDSELTQFKETFDISQKNTTQQGIRLTPEIVAKIKGESPLTKKPQQPPLEEFLAVRNRALNE